MGKHVVLTTLTNPGQSERFHSNDALEFSDFWHKGSFLFLLKTDGAGFYKKEKNW